MWRKLPNVHRKKNAKNPVASLAVIPDPPTLVFFVGGGGYMREIGTMANWRSHGETVHFFGLKSVIFGVLVLQK